MADWKEVNHTITHTYEFEDFRSALGFINKVGDLAEEAQHHPDITLFDYSKVNISLTTHDEGKVTQKDRLLAAQIDQISA